MKFNPVRFERASMLWVIAVALMAGGTLMVVVTDFTQGWIGLLLIAIGALMGGVITFTDDDRRAG